VSKRASDTCQSSLDSIDAALERLLRIFVVAEGPGTAAAAAAAAAAATGEFCKCKAEPPLLPCMCALPAALDVISLVHLHFQHIIMDAE
jgi:hypothetical protein